MKSDDFIFIQLGYRYAFGGSQYFDGFAHLLSSFGAERLASLPL
jgi:hypothetical protein